VTGCGPSGQRDHQADRALAGDPHAASEETTRGLILTLMGFGHLSAYKGKQ